MTKIQQGIEIDGYRLSEKLGSGGFGEVWRAKGPNGGDWAVKIYAAQTGLDDFTRNTFRQEYEKTAALDHPNVLRCVAYGEYDGRPYLIMPLGKGSLLGELRQRMADSRHHGTGVHIFFSEMEIARILADVADGLVYLQENGILHQDIKPANILIMDIGGQTRYVIADFGVSIQLRSNILRQTEPMYRSDQGFAPGYASPEQLTGQVGKKSDVFSLGVMLYELATGKLPFEDTGMSAGQAVSNNYRPAPLPSEFAQRFTNLVMMCLQKDPKLRPDVMQLLVWADSFVREQWWSNELGKGGVNKKMPRRQMAMAAGGVALAAIAGLAFFLMKANRGPDPSKNYQSMGEFYEKRAAVQDKSGMWGFINEAGREVVKPQFDAVMPYKDGYAVVQKGCCSCGYLNKQGDVVGTLDHKVCNQPIQGRATVTDHDGTTRTLSLK